MNDGSGLRYTVDAESGQTRAVDDRRGNRVAFTGDGIEAQRLVGNDYQTVRREDGTPVRVEFVWDEQLPRIAGVRDLRDNEVRYGYDTNGDLVSVTDRTGQLMGTYEYESNPAHFLKIARDANGTAVLTAAYEADTQRLSKLTDASGGARLAYTVAATGRRAGGHQTAREVIGVRTTIRTARERPGRRGERARSRHTR